MSDELRSTGFGHNLKSNFFYGLILILPLVATVWIVKFSIKIISGPLASFMERDVPIIVSFLLTILVIYIIGFAARNIIGNAIITFFEKFLAKIPIISIIYKSVKQIITAFSFNKKSMMDAVLVEYPRKGTWAIGFITRESDIHLFDREGKDHGEGMCSIFVPTTPNPTSGYFIYVKQTDIIRLAMSVEESIKVLMSAGVVSSRKKRKQA